MSQRNPCSDLRTPGDLGEPAREGQPIMRERRTPLDRVCFVVPAELAEQRERVLATLHVELHPHHSFAQQLVPEGHVP